MVAESVLVKHQLLILNRERKRAPNLRPADRIIAGLCTFFMGPSRLLLPSFCGLQLCCIYVVIRRIG